MHRNKREHFIHQDIKDGKRQYCDMSPTTLRSLKHQASKARRTTDKELCNGY